MKLRKKKKNVKGLIFKLLIAIIVILSVAGIIYYFLTVEDEDNNLTLLEKQWVESNKSVLVDINVPNNTYIYAKEGDGVIFDFLDYVTESVGLSFNKMPYNYTSSVNYDGLSIALLKPTDAILDNDILMLADKYVVLGKTLEDIKDISELSRKNVGILKDDETFINTYLQNKGISLKTYDNTQGLITDLNNASLSYIILPRYSYLDVITNNSLYANYVIGDLENKYVLFFKLSQISKIFELAKYENLVFLPEDRQFLHTLRYAHSTLSYVKTSSKSKFFLLNSTPFLNII